MFRLSRFYQPYVLILMAAILLTMIVGVQAQAPDDMGNCEPFMPAGWIAYTVQAGDTLSALAQRANTTTAQLQYMNCIHNRSRLQIGQVIYTPPMDSPLPLPANFALRCHEQGIEPQTCVHMMRMLGEENGNTLVIRCRAEGLAEDICQWLQTQFRNDGGNGLLMHCRNAGYDAETCYRLMLAIGQEDAETILGQCVQAELPAAECRWMLTNMHQNRVGQRDAIDATSGTQDQTRDQTRDQTCTTDCDQDQTRDQTRDQTCTTDCDQDQTRDQTRDQTCTTDCDQDRDQDQTRDRDNRESGRPSNGGGS